MADDRKPYEIEREIELERAQLAASLDALTAKFSPDAMVRTVSDQVQRHGGEATTNLLRTVKTNPTAAVLAGVGIAWLMASSGKRERAAAYDRSARRDDWNGGPYVSSDYAGGEPTLDRGPEALRVAAPAAAAIPAPAPYAEPAGTGGAYAAADTPDYASAPAASRSTGVWAEAGRRYGGGRSGGHAAYSQGSGRHTARGFADTYPADDFTARVEAADRAMRSRETGTSGFYEDEEDGRSLAERAQGIWDRATGAVQHGWENVMARAADLRDNLMEGTEGMDHEGQDRVARARARAYAAQAKAEMMASRAKREAAGFFYEQPLVTGALALAAGAALGAALPRTRREDEAFGSYRDQLFEEAERVYSEERARVEAGAAAALREAKQVAVDAKNQLTSGLDGEETVHEAESKARGAVQRISDAAKDGASKAS